MKLINCPEIYTDIGLTFSTEKVFLAGGITECPDWQQDAIHALCENDVTIFNPRRNDFNVNDPKESDFQIEWEHYHLGLADTILFWFPEETLCPITLYELGLFAGQEDGPRLVVGCHPNHKRRYDVVKQLSLVQPDVKVVDSLEELIEALNE